MLDELIEKCEIIIMGNPNDSDITQLIRLSRQLNKLYKAYNIEGTVAEENYNSYRPKQCIEYLKPDDKGKSMSIGKAEILAKVDAEEKYGNYRSKLSESYSIPKFNKIIEIFIIDYNMKRKENRGLNFNEMIGES